jgi:hypothetical protein
MCCRMTNGQIALTHSVSAGLDYASIGPEHAALHDSGRAEYVSQDDAAALEAVVRLARTEGILPALESAHAVAEALKLAPTLAAHDILVVNLSGRGDKDMGILARELKLVSVESNEKHSLLGRSPSTHHPPNRPFDDSRDGAPRLFQRKGSDDRVISDGDCFEHKPGLVVYLTAGDPSLEPRGRLRWKRLMRARM